MTEYTAEIDGNNTLNQIELAIAGEEAAGAEFVNNNIAFHGNEITNLVTFRDLPPGERPRNQIDLEKHGEPAPAGKTSIWEGVFLVSGSNEVIVAYR